MKSKLITLLLMTLIVAVASAVERGDSANAGGVRLKGYVGHRLDQMIDRHVKAMDVDYITACFKEKTERNGWWQTEFWGKWMHAAVPYCIYSNSDSLRASIDRSIETILSSQEPSGYIGNYPDELRCNEGWDVWGMKYTMMGLLHYYDMTGSEKALKACCGVCDYLIAELGPGGKRGHELWETGNWSGFASSSVLEPVVWLYKRTKDTKYLDFATYIVKGMTEPESGPRLLDLALKGISVADRNGYGNVPETHGGYVMKHNRWKSYEMMSCYQGFIEYYEVTGRKDLLDAAVATAKDIAKEEINLAGGCTTSEAWFHGASKQHLAYHYLQETCVLTTWMRFCEKLLDVTGDIRWADELERSFYNAYLASLNRDDSEFACYTPLSGSRYQGRDHCFMHQNCCNANGPRGFLCFLREFYRKSGKVITFNFYATALVDGFEMYSLYPRDGFVRIVSHTEGDAELRLRIPTWSTQTSVKVNGTTVENVTAGGYASINRSWKLGDIVEVTFDMKTAAHLLKNNVAFTRGPILLARDNRFADGDLMEPFRPYRLKDGMTMNEFTPVRTPSDEMWMAFSATLQIGVHHENSEGAYPSTVFFCDFASAANSWRRDDYCRTWFPIELGPRD